MRKAYCPKSHLKLADVTVGKPFGHVAGNKYHDVDVVISESRTGHFRVHVVETWGSSQGYEEEHGRREVIGRGDSVPEATSDAAATAHEVGILGPEHEANAFCAQALSKAQDEAIESLDKPGSNEVIATVNDADFSDCVNTGYSWQLFGSGKVVATYHSRWQGSRDGARYITDNGFIDLDDLDPNDPDSDAEALLTQVIDDLDPSDDPAFRCTSKGHTVR